ncbi:alpha/beta fold hydrolase [Dellaglioa sp. P0083]|uniref:alpha/beta fold hydrolase n=1 Tax=Dellaglioa kimchii TaxID=3344667 RepID=UPI0038D38A51
MKKWIIGICLMLIIIGLVIFGVSYYLFEYAETPTNKEFINSEPKSAELKKEYTWLKQVKKLNWQIKSEDNLKLKAIYVPAESKTNKTIFVAHGFMGKKEEMVRFIHFYHDKGYNVLAPDARAHGQSQGDYIGYGWLERKDNLQWLDKVIKYQGTDSKITLFGVSMGGATVMMLSGEKKLPSQVKAIIEDCGYTSVADELTYQLKQMYKLPKIPIIPIASLISKVKAGYSFYEASSIKQLNHNKLPVLFIHGSDDKFVPTEMIYQNYAATRGPKEIFIAHGAKHATSFTKYKVEYEKKVTHFLKQYFN